MCIDCIKSNVLSDHLFLQKMFLTTDNNDDKQKLITNNKYPEKIEKVETNEDKTKQSNYEMLTSINIEPVNKWEQPRIVLYVTRYMFNLNEYKNDITFLLNEYVKYLKENKLDDKLHQLIHLISDVKEASRDIVENKLLNLKQLLN